MKSKPNPWMDTIIAALIMVNALLFVHFLNFGSIFEQSAQILAVLLFYGWLALWLKKEF